MIMLIKVSGKWIGTKASLYSSPDRDAIMTYLKEGDPIILVNDLSDLSSVDELEDIDNDKIKIV